MSLSLAGMIAKDSLGSISAQTNVVSRNIANAETPGYSKKIPRLATDLIGSSHLTGVDRASNLALSRSLLSANAAFGRSDTITKNLAQLESYLNISSASPSETSSAMTPAAGIARLQAALQNFRANPADVTAANDFLTQSRGLAQILRDATENVQQIRQDADASIFASVSRINDMLTRFESTNRKIVAGSTTGADISDELDRRDQILNELSSEIGIKTVLRQNNDMVIYSDSGMTMFETTPRNISFTAIQPYTAATSGNNIFVDGVPITNGPNRPSEPPSGRLIGLIEIRDEVAPKFQAQLDEIARGLIVAFAETDQTGAAAPPLPGLFTFPGATGFPAPSIIPGLAGAITVNATVDPEQGGDIKRLRDGGISLPGNNAYVYNKSGDAGFSGRILEMISVLSKPLDCNDPVDFCSGNMT